MLMNLKTRQSLDFERIMADLLPSSPFGVRYKNEMKPYLSSDAENLAVELNRVLMMKELIISQAEILREIKASLKQIKDIHRSVERCIKGGTLNQIELFELKSLLLLMKSLHSYQNKLRCTLEEDYQINELPKVMELLDPQGTGMRTFYIYDEYSEKLRDLRLIRAAKEQTLEQLRKKAIEDVEQETGLKFKATGEYIASKSHDELIAKLDACESLHQAGETFINVTYKVKPNREMADCMKQIEDLKGEELIEEAKVLQELSEKLAGYGDEVLRNIAAIGAFDLLIAKGELALRYHAVKPELTTDGRCTIINGINPIVDKELHKKGKKYMPISADMTAGVTLITGANMGGKTVSLKMLGLLTAMAQYGLLVPAESMRFQPFDFIYISCGDEQSVDLGLSTFGGEIKSIAEVLVQADNRGLVLLDELARGTNPKEGYAISAALIDYLQTKPCMSVITTHLEGLERNVAKHLRVKGLHDIDFDSIKDYTDISEYMDYSLIEVQDSRSIPEDAIRISKIMGLPDEIIEKAEQIMREKK